MFSNWIGGVGLSALCFSGLTPELRALAFSTNTWAGVAFLLLAGYLIDMRDKLLRFLPPGLSLATVGFLFFCGVHHLLFAATILVDLSRMDAVVVGLTAVFASIALWKLRHEVPAWVAANLHHRRDE